MKIAVIEDERYSREELVHQILEVLPQAQIFQAASGVEGMELLEGETFDVLFLDIRLGDMLGTTVATLARKLMPNAQIIFATAYSEYGVKAFELGVDNYILKPFDPKRVRQVLEGCMPADKTEPPASVAVQKIPVMVNRCTTLLDAADIVYIETTGAGRQCIVHTRDKSYTVTVPLSEYESKLTHLGFYRVHKTCLVQLQLIQDIFPWSNNGFALHMQGSTATLPIGRDRIKKLRQLLHL